MSKPKPKPEPKHSYIISNRRETPIGGFGGFDEWTLYDLTNKRADLFFDHLQKLVELFGGEFTGAN
jgi:hypothetical protein